MFAAVHSQDKQCVLYEIKVCFSVTLDKIINKNNK